MSMYPSLEDMKVDQIQQAQVHAAQVYERQQSYPRVSEGTPYPASNGVGGAPVPSMDLAGMYPSLMDDYMGLRLEPPTGPIPAAGPGAVVRSAGMGVAVPAGQSGGQMVAPLSGGDAGLARANVTHGVREVVTCKDEKGKVGMRLRGVDKGVFVQFVQLHSPAALAGIRFGDQILQINGENLAGYSGDKAMGLLKKADPKRIVFAIRDRPFERTITLHKDSSGHVGFVYKENRIDKIAKDTSAARNGLLIDHYILEVNGQNVIGLKDKEMGEIFAKCGQIVTLTIMPGFVYTHMVKCMSDDLLKKKMDHSIPEVY